MKDVFRIEAFVEDKNLARVKRLLSGLTFDFKDQPVVNANVKNGKVVAKVNGNMPDLFLAWVKENKLRVITPKNMREFVNSIGRSPGSYSNFLSRLIKAGLLRKTPGSKGSSISYKMVRK